MQHTKDYNFIPNNPYLINYAFKNWGSQRDYRVFFLHLFKNKKNVIKFYWFKKKPKTKNLKIK